jgi:DnaJ-class molecular chaperone
VLSDADKRKIYDQFGEEGLKGGGGGGGFGGGGQHGYGGVDNDTAERIFRSFFGGAGGRWAGRHTLNPHFQSTLAFHSFSPHFSSPTLSLLAY